MDEIQEALANARDAIAARYGEASDRALALTITKVDEALLWYGVHLQEQMIKASMNGEN